MQRSPFLHRLRIWAIPLVTIAAVLTALLQTSCHLIIGDLPAATEDAGSTDLDAQGSDAAAATGGTLGQGGTGGNAAGGSETGGDTSGGNPNGGSATGGTAAGGTGGTCCDCDGDGVDGPQCTDGNDCDDDNEDIFPGQERFFFTPDARRAYDYDCSDSEDPQYTSVVDCSSLVCDTTTEGFFGMAPACGQSGSWGRCVKNLAVCEEGTGTNKTMGCR